MKMSVLKKVVVLALLLLPLGMAGCYVHAVGPDAEVVVGNYGYEPMYYDGYVVFYDEAGRPFYYVGATRVYIPPSSPYYATYVAHYRMYAPYYARWYAQHGYRYHTFRVTAGYYGGHRVYIQTYRRPARHR